MFVLGLDLGKSNDPTALALLRVRDTVAGLSVPRAMQLIECIDLERIPLGTPYTEIVEYVAWRIDRTPSALVIDATGVGKPVVDMFNAAHVGNIAITITGGSRHTVVPGGYHVPKKDLIGALQVVLQRDLLKVAGSLQHAPALRNELTKFKAKQSSSGYVSLEAWRESDHDDLVLALAIGVWYVRDADRALPLRAKSLSFRR